MCYGTHLGLCRPEEALLTGDGCIQIRLGWRRMEDGKYHPVVYASHALHGSKANYHSSKLEFIALKWAVTQQFKEYLMYQPFTL